ncbi:MAG TPA: SRPBCC family protein, partial [Bacteroidia bacterium]|nr:SRPBCC family protein [Bacteroidia bacterium]
TKDRELSIERLLNAPIELVWEVWTKPEHIKNWWGPADFTNSIDKMEVKPGGTWDLIMHGPDGTDYKNKSIFTEIVKHKRIAYDHVSSPKFRAEANFTPQGNKTLLQWKMVFELPEQLQEVVKVFKADVGLTQNVDKLEDYLKAADQMNTAPFVIERTFAAPIEKVWKAISDKNEMKKWYFDLPEFEARVGVEFTFTGGPPEKQYIHLCKVTEVIENKKLSYSWRYDGYPGNSFVTFELFAEGNKTKLKLTHAGLESFAASNNPDLYKQNFVAGWTEIIGTNFKQFIEK